MKPRQCQWAWENQPDKAEHIATQEVLHMLWLFRAAKLDGRRLFFIERVGHHCYRVTHALGGAAVISWVIPTHNPQPLED